MTGRSTFKIHITHEAGATFFAIVRTGAMPAPLAAHEITPANPAPDPNSRAAPQARPGRGGGMRTFRSDKQRPAQANPESNGWCEDWRPACKPGA